MTKTSIPYGTTNWNIDEVNSYIQISPKINTVISGGDVKKAIQEILKNDMAYFIQQINGKFTIRRYGESYKEHTLPSWIVTKKPEKDYSKAMEHYFSSCVINYDYNDETYKSYLYDELEFQAEYEYKKKIRKTFDTELIDADDVKNLTILLGNRFTKIKQSIKLGVGIDTSSMDLLDTVYIEMKVNDRKFSNATKFIITEINPAQDILTLEEI
jgi:hypothetical protein